MKYSLILSISIFFFLPFRLFCQVDVWTTPVPLTDSLSDNRNAIVVDVDFYSGEDIYVFWEKSTDSTSTDIYSRRYYSEEDPVALVSEGDFHYLDPRILKTADISYPPGDTTFFLFYLSNQDGNFDIYYKKYANGNFTEPVALTSTPGDEKHLRSSGYRGLTWEYEGKILYDRLDKISGGPFFFKGIIVVDSGNCSNPELEPAPDYNNGGESFIAWEKVFGDSSRIMISYWDWASGYGWTTPEIIDSIGHNTHPRFEESTFQEVGTTLCWDNLDAAGDRRVICTDPMDTPEDFFVLEMVQGIAYYPAVFNIFMGASYLWDYAILTYIKDENGQSDIYVPVYPMLSSWPADYFNLSNSGVPETNPLLWNGNYYGEYQDVINIWESWRNGHWQLYTSRILVLIMGAVDEKNQKSPGLLSVSPNPFKEQVVLTFKSEMTGKASIILYDGMGRNIGTLLETEIQTGNQSWVIDPETNTGCKLPAGIYFIRLEVEGRNFTVKLVKSD